MELVSVIIPIYNVENYLEKCIKSLVSQTYSNIEIILVDDGSTDNGKQIIEKYVQIDERCRAIYKKNGGVSSARNAGLQAAKGRYVSFVDPDDSVDQRMYEELIPYFDDPTIGCVCCSWKTEHPNGTVEPHNLDISLGRVNQIDIIGHIFDSPRTILGSVWNKIFIRDKIKEYFDVDKTMGEDTLFLIHYLSNIEYAYITNKPYYSVYARPNSAMRLVPEKMALGLDVWRDAIKVVEPIDKELKKLSEKNYWDACLFFWRLIRKGNNIQYKDIISVHFYEGVVKQLPDVIKNEYLSWKIKTVFCKEALMYLGRTVKGKIFK